MEAQKFHKAIDSILELGGQANEYIDRQAPWKLKKEDPERMKSVLYVLAESIRCIAIALQPFIPQSSAKILDQLNIPQDKRGLVDMSADSALKVGTELPKPEGVFPRLEMPENQKEAS